LGFDNSAVFWQEKSANRLAAMRAAIFIKSAIKYIKLHPGVTDCRAAL
jgi:hypothetical protein